jgi:hypothetical protein
LTKGKINGKINKKLLNAVITDEYLKAETKESRCWWKYGVSIQRRWSVGAGFSGGYVIAFH